MSEEKVYISELGLYVDKLLRESNLSKTEIADNLGISREWLRQIRKEGRRPAMEVLVRLAKLTSTDTNEILRVAKYLGESEYMVDIEVPNIGQLLIKTLIPVLSDEQQQEVIRLVAETLAKQSP